MSDRYIRLVKGGAYQARPWLGSVRWNLGLYHPDDYPDDRGRPDRGTAIAAALRACNEFQRRCELRWCVDDDLLTTVTIAWSVTRELQRWVRFGRPVVQPGVLPPYVVRHPAGGYVARSRFVKIASPIGSASPFSSPIAACLAMLTYTTAIHTPLSLPSTPAAALCAR